MGRKKKEPLEFRYYDTPQDEPVLALLGQDWDRRYGHDAEGIHVHFHNLMEIGICIRGSGEMTFSEQTRRYEGGMFTLIPSNYPHTTYSYGEGTNAWEYFFLDPVRVCQAMEPDDPARRRELLYWLGLRAWLLEPQEEPEMAVLIRLILDEMRGKGEYYKGAVQRLTESLVLLIARRNRRILRGGEGAASQKGGSFEENRSFEPTGLVQGAPAGAGEEISRDACRIFPVFDYVDEHYADPIRVRDLARVCNMSETHVRRLFESIMHMSPTDYVNLVRIQKACELLKKTDEPLDLIAARCGYGNVSTLSRNFKKLLGVTPYQWKKLPDNYERGLLQFRVSAIRGW